MNLYFQICKFLCPLKLFVQFRWKVKKLLRLKEFTKVEVSSESESGHEFKFFPTNIWIFKFIFLIVFTIKMLLDYTSTALLNLLEFKCNHYNSLFLAESEFKNSNVGGKELDLMSWLCFRRDFDFSN